MSVNRQVIALCAIAFAVACTSPSSSPSSSEASAEVHWSPPQTKSEIARQTEVSQDWQVLRVEGPAWNWDLESQFHLRLVKVDPKQATTVSEVYQLCVEQEETTSYASVTMPSGEERKFVPLGHGKAGPDGVRPVRFAANLSREDLARYRDSGLSLQFFSATALPFRVEVPPHYIQGFLDRVDVALVATEAPPPSWQ